MKATDVLAGIIKKNGDVYQITIAIEELSELTKELTKYIRGKVSYKDICEEIADVEICLAEIKLIIPNSKEQILLFKQFKLKRLEKLYLNGVER